MSSLAREPLTGIILQDRKIVGGVCLPEEDVGLFIDQFNHCYGPLRMRIDKSSLVENLAPEATLPVGACRHNPFRPRES